MTSDRPTHIVYNTGDEIWVTYNGDKPRVTRIRTHDGIVWDDGSSPEGGSLLDGGGDGFQAVRPGSGDDSINHPSSPRKNPFFPMLREVMEMDNKKKLIYEMIPLAVLIVIITWLVIRNNHC